MSTSTGVGVDGFSLTNNVRRSKPIRRPQLKKVLKQYIAPIPEESEEVTPPVVRPGKGSVGTAVVMTNKSDAGEQQADRGRTEAIPQRSADGEPALKASDDLPVSPFSTS